MIKLKLTKPTEHDEQVKLFQWADAQRCLYPALDGLYAVPNQRKWTFSVWAYFESEGVKRGIPDVVLPVGNKDHNALYIEMKRITEKNTKDKGLTKAQSDKIDLLNKLGNLAVVCYSFDEARDVILSYLANKNNNECALVSKLVKDIT